MSSSLPRPTSVPWAPPLAPAAPGRTTAAQRRAMLEACGWNLFRVPADMVAIDLLTDSGTGTMSSAQWSAMMRADESYAGSASFHRLAETLARLTGFTNVLPTHQGRVAERLLVETVIGEERGCGAGLVVPNNAHFDTTRRMIEASGARAIDLLCAGGDDPDLHAPFKGDMDVEALERLLRQRADDVPFVMLTLTCNSNGGQPVSLANLHAVRNVCDRYGTMLALDACRFAENAWMIRERELAAGAGPDSDAAPRASVPHIVREIFDLADAVAMSTRKDGLCNCGGLLLLRDDRLHRRACSLCVLTRGFQMTYGSLPGRDLEAMAVGLEEVMDHAYLAQRAGEIARLAEALERGGVKIVRPAGGHAVFIDAEHFCPHLAQASTARCGTAATSSARAGHALACAIYESAGIRCTPIGTALMQRDARNAGAGQPSDLVRLAIPRRRYSRTQLDEVAAAIIALHAEAKRIEPRPMPHDLDQVPAPPAQARRRSRAGERLAR